MIEADGTESIASLPMYDLPRLRPVTDRWWSAIAIALRDQGVPDVPERLDRARPREDAWTSPALLLSQTCGYPLTHAHAGELRVIAVPRYRAPGCTAWRYSSLVIVRRDDRARDPRDLLGRTFAANARDSHSGWNVLQHLLAPLAGAALAPDEVVWTGAHTDSIAAVASGAADACAVDCVSHALLARHAPPALAGTRVLARTVAAPALPYVTRAAAGDELVGRLRAGLEQAASSPALAAVREALLIDGFADPPPDCYEEILAIERARAAG